MFQKGLVGGQTDAQQRGAQTHRALPRGRGQRGVAVGTGAAGGAVAGLLGVVLTMYDARNRLTREVRDEVQRCFPDHLFGTVIPRNVRLSEAPSHGKPINYYDRVSRGAEAYSNLANEFLKQNK